MSQTPGEEDAVSFSFMLRCVQKTIEVFADSNRLVNPKITPKKTKWFDDANDIYKTTEEYKAAELSIRSKIEKMFKRY